MAARRVWLYPVVGLLILAAAPALLRVTPPMSGTAPVRWEVPAEAGQAEQAGALAPTLNAPPLEGAEHLLIRSGGKVFVFQRQVYTVQRVDKDLVPWFPDITEGRWIKGDIERSAEEPVASRLLQSTTGANRVLAWSYRVGPYASTSFNVAKLLQIPAKLRGHNQFDMLTLTADCGRDCAAVSEESRRVLRAVIRHNTEAP